MWFSVPSTCMKIYKQRFLEEEQRDVHLEGRWSPMVGKKKEIKQCDWRNLVTETYWSIITVVIITLLSQQLSSAHSGHTEEIC